MLLFIKPSFVNELNEGEAPPRRIFNPSFSLSRDHFSPDAGTSPGEDVCDFFRSDYPANSHFTAPVKAGFVENASSLEDFGSAGFLKMGESGSFEERARNSIANRGI